MKMCMRVYKDRYERNTRKAGVRKVSLASVHQVLEFS